MAAADIPTGSFDFFNDLVGIWEGPGFNQIILPTQDRSVFRRKFDATFERFVNSPPTLGPLLTVVLSARVISISVVSAICRLSAIETSPPRGRKRSFMSNRASF